jgi:vanillate O-demethylase monooxygenase subunit
VAIGNVCPHRFAPLSEGRRYGDNIACPYHGLEFAPDGQCVRNPNGDRSRETDGPIPKSCRVPSYPLEERWGILFIWMGDPEKADLEKLPDYSMTRPREGRAVVYGHHTVNAHYELVVDNLMDRTHVQFLHPMLDLGENLPPNFKREHSFEQDGNTVWDYHCERNSGPKGRLKDIFWPEAPEVLDSHFNVRWEPPSNMLLNAGFTGAGQALEDGAHNPGANMITPANEHKTHYFWNICRNRNIESDEVSQMIQQGVNHTFANEDGPICELCEKHMRSTDLLALNPVLLEHDGAAIRARRILAKLIAEEQADA